MNASNTVGKSTDHKISTISRQKFIIIVNSNIIVIRQCAIHFTASHLTVCEDLFIPTATQTSHNLKTMPKAPTGSGASCRVAQDPLTTTPSRICLPTPSDPVNSLTELIAPWSRLTAVAGSYLEVCSLHPCTQNALRTLEIRIVRHCRFRLHHLPTFNHKAVPHMQAAQVTTK